MVGVVLVLDVRVVVHGAEQVLGIVRDYLTNNTQIILKDSGDFRLKNLISPFILEINIYLLPIFFYIQYD